LVLESSGSRQLKVGDPSLQFLTDPPVWQTDERTDRQNCDGWDSQ